MITLTLAGAAMVATSVIGIAKLTPTAQLKGTLTRYFEANKLVGVKVQGIYSMENGYKCAISLPMNITAMELKEHLPGIEQVTGTFVRFSYKGGALVYLEFGYADFGPRMTLPVRSYIEPMTVPLFTPFGKCAIDFRQETSCHMLVGGATRMGKTAFIRLLAAALISGTRGAVSIKMIDNKVNDLYMFRNVPQIEIGETEEDALTLLASTYQEVERRKALLKRYDDCIDMIEYRRKHPNADPVDPLFIIIDEYGRFSDVEPVQKLVEKLVETAGYLDVHVIIASQRPDAQTVLKARIKANLTTRLCFTTIDEMNSKVVIDVPDAARLGKIQGRAVLMDGFIEVVQVPFLSTGAAMEMLQPYKEVDSSVVGSGSENYQDSESFQGFEPQAVGEDHIPEPPKRNRNRKSGAKKAGS